MHVFGHNILVYALLGANVGVAVFAIWKGDAAVRWAAVTQIGASYISLFNFVLGPEWNQTFELATGLVSAVVYLLLAVRFANLWIGAAMLLQAAEFSLDAFYLVTDRPLDHLHAWVNNTCEWGIVLCILLGAVLAILRRMTLAREAAELAARRQQRASAAA
jgi:signal transduction histidine kinase